MAVLNLRRLHGEPLRSVSTTERLEAPQSVVVSHEARPPRPLVKLPIGPGPVLGRRLWESRKPL